jgi:hypothetical protein
MRLLTCATVRRRLAAFHDRELPVGEMISFESHIKDCPPCAGELAELQNVGNLLRMAAAPAPADEWAGLAPGVVGRMCAENHESLRARVGRVFEDMHFVWIALASTTATFLCGAVALGTLQFASPERHDSMAAVIAVMAAPSGSDLNPARLDGRYRFPSVPQDSVVQRMLESTALADGVSDTDTMLAVSAVVTREGRVSDVAVLGNDRHGHQISSILDAISQVRLEPAELGWATSQTLGRARVGDGSPVAVNLVWLLAQTTVKPKNRS